MKSYWFSTFVKLFVGFVVCLCAYWPIRWWVNEFHLFLFVLTLIFGSVVIFQKKEVIRAVFLTLLSISLMWMVIEYGFLISKRFVSPHAKANKTFSCGASKPMGRRDVELGYRGVPGPVVCTSKLFRGEDDVHQSTYTLDEHGFRVTPETNQHGAGIVFFGGSNMVGELVNDHETLPYYVSQRLNHRYNIVNLGWSGWGPHQMLRILETGIVGDVIKGSLRGAVLKTAIWHTQRVLGYSFWDQQGPRYEKQANGGVTYRGPFKTDGRLALEKRLKQSHLINWIFQRTQTISSGDIELYIDVIARASALLREHYGVPLTILFMPSPDLPEGYGGYTDQMVIHRLRQEGLIVLEGSDVIDDYQAPEMMVEGDGHPTPIAYDLESKLIALFFEEQEKE